MRLNILAGVCITTLFIASCATKVTSSKDQVEKRVYRDETISMPSIYFEETKESKSVIGSSKFYAVANYCELIKRHSIRTNVDQTASINLFKYRAYLMGAHRVVFLDEKEARLQKADLNSENVEMIVKAGSSIKEAKYDTLIIADLYECPKN
jgi:hypothetical protein